MSAEAPGSEYEGSRAPIAAGATASLIVGIGGTARSHSTSELVAVEALRAAPRLGAATMLFNGNFGQCSESRAGEEIARVAAQVVEFARWQRPKN